MIFRYKNKRHTNISRVITFCVSLIFLISCGIPTSLYLNNGIVDSDDISYYKFLSEKNDSEPLYTTTLDLKIVDADIVSDSPSLCYFYAIYPINITDNISEKSFVSKIQSAFNTKYSILPGKRLSIDSQSDPYVLNVNYLDNDFKLYKFTYDDFEQNAISYLATIKSLTSNTPYSINFDIEQKNDSGEDGIYFEFSENGSSLFKSTNQSDIETNSLKLKRYNNALFSSSVDSDDVEFDYSDSDLSNGYKVIVFAALTVEGNFSNIFWSELHNVGSFDI